MPNSKKIKARITELGTTIQKISKEMGLSAYTLGQKIAGKTPMSLDEAFKLQEILRISDGEFKLYFISCIATDKS